MTRYLIDSSIWIPILRGDRTLRDRLRQLPAGPEALLTCGPIQAELIAGLTTRNADAIHAISRGLACLSLPSVDSFIHAGELKARARQKGRPVRGIADCLIAVIAAAHVGVVLIHRDQDFTTLASLMNLDADHWSS